MLRVVKDLSFEGTGIPFGVLEVRYPPKGEWDTRAFGECKEDELRVIKAGAAGYDRKKDFGDEVYFRYFRGFKKSYPVMLQLESVLLKDKPFPDFNPVYEVMFLAELRSRMLLGVHDVDRIQGALVLFRGTEKTPFAGMGGRDAHIYPGDVSGKDDGGIILSMLAGADDRTCVSPDTLHPAYFVFGVDGMENGPVNAALDLLERYAKILAPGASLERAIV
jgi:DNA/RNA-binding domain of Phe-tRNA-synthetase-like protein